MGGYPGMMGGVAQGQPAVPGIGGTPAEGRVEDPAAREADARSVAALQKGISVQFDGAPLTDVLDFFADSTGLDVVTDWKSLEAEGVDRSAPVSLRLRQNAPAEQALSYLLRSAGGDNIGFAIDHGVVVVASRSRLDRMVVTRAYDASGLADGDLASLVRETVSPSSWRENSGPGSARVYNGRLVVTATEPNHRQVERLLGLLRAEGGGGGDAGKGIGPGPGGAPGAGAPFPGQPSRQPASLRVR
jgi:hypothetical protein